MCVCVCVCVAFKIATVILLPDASSLRVCRIQATLGDEYVVYLLSDQEEKPCVVVFPREAVDAGAPSAAVEVCPPQSSHILKLMISSICIPIIDSRAAAVSLIRIAVEEDGLAARST